MQGAPGASSNLLFRMQEGSVWEEGILLILLTFLFVEVNHHYCLNLIYGVTYTKTYQCM